VIPLVRTSLVFLALAAAVATTASAQSPRPTAAYGEALFVVSGRGYGHGVGMSQYGALGQAKAGRTHDQILAHYYAGTELGRAATKEVRVLLAEGRSAVTVASTVPFRATDAAGRTYRFPAGPLTLRPGLELPVPDEGAAFEQPEPTPPLLVAPGKSTAPLSLDGRPYRGKLEMAVQGGYLRVVNVVGLESYLQGVVPGEMPHGWPAEALQAQAVAARSYALANLVKGKPFDLYADVRSQVYAGVAGERPSTTQAVKATAGQVVTYAGKVASTLYFSSSGGRTASAADVFGAPVPYLVSRPDPWDKGSPYFRWGPVLLGARTVQAKLGADARVVDARAVGTPSGRIRSLALTTTAGTETVPASLVRTALGLRSTWITVGVLRLDRPATGTITFGSSVRLAGIVRGVNLAALASSLDGKSWTAGPPLAPDPSGAFALDAKPQRTSRYRIVADDAASPAQLVQVAPRIQLSPPTEPDVLTGTVRPRLSGAIVSVERRKGSVWAAVADGVVDAAGGFRVELALVPGAYRARIGATDGLGEARSAVLQVTG
jgi:stage II sporulation protein D